MLYLIGLGLNKEGFSYEAFNVIKNCRRVYLEVYTTKLPYNIEDIEELIQKRIIPADRDIVESDFLVKQAKDKNVALLIYGSPLIATTHISLIQEAKKHNIPVRILHNASILDSVSETGLQIYKFGKIASMPNFDADSFIEIIKENQKINAHSLILIDIDLNFKDAIDKLEKTIKKKGINIDKLIICEQLGTNANNIYYDKIEKLKRKNIKAPFCFIIPGKLHFLENEVLESFSFSNPSTSQLKKS